MPAVIETPHRPLSNHDHIEAAVGIVAAVIRVLQRKLLGQQDRNALPTPSRLCKFFCTSAFKHAVQENAISVLSRA
jgi:hypothetical protein